MTVHVSEAQLGAILDAIPAQVVLFDRALRHRYSNQDYARFAAMPAEDLQGRPLAEIAGAAASAILSAQTAQALAGETVHWDGWLPYGEGSDPRFVQSLCLPFRAPGGEIDGCLVFLRDLTELKRSEQRLSDQLADLRLSQALNAAITASALDCVIVIDEAGCVVEFNPAAELTFGHARAAVIGRPIGDIIVPEHLRARHAHGFARYLATGEAHVLGRRMEIEGLRSNGEVFPLELAITEVRLPDRRLFTAYLRDLTGAKAAAADIQQSRDALHQSEKLAAFGSLLAGVAHELNNPLAIVVGNAMMLAEDTAGEASVVSMRAEKIGAAAERCARIVRSFLAMARQRPTLLRPIDVAPLVNDAAEMLAYGIRAAGIAMEVDVPEDLPSAMGDPDQLHQVLVNLTLNAQQALVGHQGARRIAIAARVELGEMVVRVADSGPGIPPAIRGRIFDPFFTTKPMGEGTGIGLAVSRGIVEAHGGTLTLASSDGTGACFEVRLRLSAHEGALPGAPTPSLTVQLSSPLASAPTAAPVAAPAPPRRALVIDDEPEVASVLAQMVAARGFACDIAAGGVQGIELLRAYEYDAIFCDLHMPDTSGAALAEWLGIHRPHLLTRLAFVTGDTLGKATAGFLRQSGRPHLEKPFVPDDILRVLTALTDSA